MEGKTLYTSIYEYLLTRIHYGFYPKGEPLPSIYQLSRQFGVSTMAVRNAYTILEQNGYIQREKGARSAIICAFDHSGAKSPDHALLSKQILENSQQSLDLIFPGAFYYGLLLCNEPQMQKLRQILKRPAIAWDEPVVEFPAHLAMGLKNPLLLDLYYDAILFHHPSYLVFVAENPQKWNSRYPLLRQRFEDMLNLKEHREYTALWELIKGAFADFTPHLHRCQTDFKNTFYHWGKPQICLNTASELVFRIYSGRYPLDTLLPPPRILSEELSVPLITIRRTITMLNHLGALKSINGIGTKTISPEQGLHLVKWDNPAIQKNILLYLQALHILVITCHPLVNFIFPTLNDNERERIKNEIHQIGAEKHTAAAIFAALKALTRSSGMPTLQAIYDRFFCLLIWGQPITYIEPYLQLDSYAARIIAGLSKNDLVLFKNALEEALAVTFLSSREKALSMGIREAENLLLPEEIMRIQ